MSQGKTTPKFRAAYAELNLEQRQAVDTIEGPVMVVAGPGTGKTQTIALRIANILSRTDTDPDAILALTYTESGARAMRQRLASFIGTPAYYCNISTFHSFCTEIIADNPDAFTIDPSSEPLSELEKLRLIYKILDSGRYKLLRPVNAHYYYAPAVVGALSDLKREGVSPAQLQELLETEKSYLAGSDSQALKKGERAKREKNLAKNLELLTLFRTYQKDLLAVKRYDFEDMINLVVEAFSNDHNLLLSYQERFQYFMVDEYQDTNSSQNKLLLLLASYWGDEANVMVTGDPDQSIMRFQGASIENQLDFVKNYPRAKVITLRENYRSSQVILDVADSLISHNNLRINDVVKGIDPHLNSVRGDGPSIKLAALSTGTAELVFLAEQIKQLLSQGTSAGDIAVIFHNNNDAKVLSEIFVKYGIDYRVQGGADILEDPTVNNFVKILRVIYEMRRREEDEDLFTILHYQIFGLDPLDVLKLARIAGDKHLSLFDVLASPSLLDELELRDKQKLSSVIDQLGAWSAIDAENTFVTTFETVLSESGYLTWVLGQADSHHRLSRLNTLFDEVKKMNRFDHELDLKGFLENLDLMRENHLKIEENSFGVSDEAVTLTTAHKSKGLEWDYVFIYKSIDKTWGNNRRRDLIKLPDNLLKNTDLSDKEKNEDERRLFYVAATRARTGLTLSYANKYSVAGAVREVVPSMFIAELGDSQVESVDTQAVEESAGIHLENLLSPLSPSQASLESDERDYLAELVSKFTLSPTTLNKYLECAYKFKLDSLLRVPHAKKPHLAFGTAVHRALELFYRSLQDGAVMGKEQFISQFAHALESEVISKRDFEERVEEGKRILDPYYDEVLASATPPLDIEKSSHVTLGDVPLSGKLDRIEWLSRDHKTVRMVDYKTGKVKTMGQIEGTTQDSEGDLKRQLTFYRLLIDLDPRLRYKFGDAMLDFVAAPADVSRDGRRAVLVQEEEVTELKKLILDVMRKIRALDFTRTKNLKTCETCYFKDHCYPGGIPTT